LAGKFLSDGAPAEINQLALSVLAHLNQRDFLEPTNSFSFPLNVVTPRRAECLRHQFQHAFLDHVGTKSMANKMANGSSGNRQF
jgi:hypothetical protein